MKKTIYLLVVCLSTLNLYSQENSDHFLPLNVFVNAINEMIPSLNQVNRHAVDRYASGVESFLKAIFDIERPTTVSRDLSDEIQSDLDLMSDNLRRSQSFLITSSLLNNTKNKGDKQELLIDRILSQMREIPISDTDSKENDKYNNFYLQAKKHFLFKDKKTLTVEKRNFRKTFIERIKQEENIDQFLDSLLEIEIQSTFKIYLLLAKKFFYHQYRESSRDNEEVALEKFMMNQIFFATGKEDPHSIALLNKWLPEIKETQSYSLDDATVLLNIKINGLNKILSTEEEKYLTIDYEGPLKMVGYSIKSKLVHMCYVLTYESIVAEGINGTNGVGLLFLDSALHQKIGVMRDDFRDLPMVTMISNPNRYKKHQNVTTEDVRSAQRDILQQLRKRLQIILRTKQQLKDREHSLSSKEKILQDVITFYPNSIATILCNAPWYAVFLKTPIKNIVHNEFLINVALTTGAITVTTLVTATLVLSGVGLVMAPAVITGATVVHTIGLGLALASLPVGVTISRMALTSWRIKHSKMLLAEHARAYLTQEGDIHSLLHVGQEAQFIEEHERLFKKDKVLFLLPYLSVVPGLGIPMAIFNIVSTPSRISTTYHIVFEKKSKSYQKLLLKIKPYIDIAESIGLQRFIALVKAVIDSTTPQIANAFFNALMQKNIKDPALFNTYLSNKVFPALLFKFPEEQSIIYDFATTLSQYDPLVQIKLN